MENFKHKNYSNKIRKIIPNDVSTHNEEEMVSSINWLINFMNYCFFQRNNFFVDNFNKRQIRNVLNTYNSIRSNIIIPQHNTTVFSNLTISDLKQLKFILLRNINNNSECVSKKYLQVCLDLLNHEIIKNSTK